MHPRFSALTRNIRLRRTAHVSIHVPLFLDARTDPAAGAAAGVPAGPGVPAAAPRIHMDAMCFGMGCSCLQTTLQARDMAQGRFLYDQLGIVAPLFLALTAATPVFRGLLADQDVRWNVIAQSVDDRPPAERKVLPKSRFESISLFLSQSPLHRGEYDDVAAPVDAAAQRALLEAGVDPVLSRHVAHLFTRDPLVVYPGDEQDTTGTAHFENIQTTNWQSVRFKLPPTVCPRPAQELTGWRVELRTMELQLTELENAAFVTVVQLLTRALLHFGLNLYMPMSRVDENMVRAHTRDAVRTQTFWMRRHILPAEHGANGGLGNGGGGGGGGPDSVCKTLLTHGLCLDTLRAPHYLRPAQVAAAAAGGDPAGGGEAVVEMTLDQIWNGSPADSPLGSFPGLLKLVRAYLDYYQSSLLSLLGTPCDADGGARTLGAQSAECHGTPLSPHGYARLQLYLDLVAARARGTLPTPACWIRSRLLGHADYRQDSVVSEKMAADLVLDIEAQVARLYTARELPEWLRPTCAAPSAGLSRELLLDPAVYARLQRHTAGSHLYPDMGLPDEAAEAAEAAASWQRARTPPLRRLAPLSRHGSARRSR